MSSEPLVTCIMPTRGRPAFAQAAVECFLFQTWRNKELVIVDDVDSPSFSGPPKLDRVYYIGLRERRTIGSKRNLACVTAAGSIIVHFDDDDFSAPARIEDQVNRLLGSGKPVTGYRSMRFTDGAAWWQYSGVEDYALGTSLCYFRDWWKSNKFKELDLSEDNDFVQRARSRGQITSVDAGDMMHATIHPGNTSARELNTAQWRRLAA